MKNQNYSSKFIALFSIAFAFVFFLSTTQEVTAQRYLTEIKSGSEAKGIAQFANDLSAFLEIAEFIEQENIVSPRDIAKLQAAGKKVKDGTSNFRSNIKNLVTKLKNKNQWDDELDTEINDLFGSRKIKGFFKRNGGRKILTDVDSAIGSLNSDIDAIIANAKNEKASNSNGTGEFFMQASFVPCSTISLRKLKLKCVILGAAIFGAELVKADRTAENLDGFFDKNCGAGANTAT